MKCSTLLASCFLFFMLPVNAKIQQKKDKPNFIFIISDDHRWDAIGAAGNTKIKTPVLDQLAKEGVYFRQATIHVAQCAPSRATLLTGLSPHQTGYYSNNFLRSDLEWATRFTVPTMTELMVQAGYETVLVGKWHLATDPWLTGFSNVRTWLPEAGSSYLDSRLSKGNSRNKEMVNGFTNQIFAEDAIDFLNSDAATKKSFLLWFASTLPHDPYKPNPPNVTSLYEDHGEGDLIPKTFPVNSEVLLGLEGAPPQAIPPGIKDYYAAVSYLDELVGKIRQTLKRRGLAENTIIIFMGDNGLMAGSRGLRGKVVPWDESVRVPLIIYAPKFSTIKGTSDLPVSSLDLPATILSFAGIKSPQSWAGRDLRKALTGKKDHGIEYAVSEWADTESQFRHYTYRSIRTPQYKLIKWDKPEKQDEFYDLVSDPHETKNLINSTDVRNSRNKLSSQLDTWMIRTKDHARVWPAKNGKTTTAIEETTSENTIRAELMDKTPVKINADQFDAYVGSYEFVTRITLQIARDGDKLLILGEMGGRSELIPKSDNVFVHPTLPMRITFVKNDKGEVTHLIRRTSISTDVKTIDMKARKIG